MRPSMAALLAVLLILGAKASGQNRTASGDFWKLDSERSGSLTVSTFSAKSSPARGQGLLMWAHWDDEAAKTAELEPSVVLASLYSDLQEFQLLGRKEVSWAGQPAQLVAFRATVNKRPVSGRSLLAQTSSGSEALLLVTNQGAQGEFSKEFARLQSRWEFGRPAASNVLNSPISP